MTDAQLERNAMRAISEALASLRDADSRRRVLQWVDDCLQMMQLSDHAAEVPVDRPNAWSLEQAARGTPNSDLSFDGVDGLFDEFDAAPVAGTTQGDDADAELDSLVRELATKLQRCADALSTSN